MATIGFALHLLWYRNAERNGDKYGFKYPINPKKLSQMGEAWLTKALRSAGTISSKIEVMTMQIKEPEKKGLMGDIRVMEVSYKGLDDTVDNDDVKAELDVAPTKMMAKFASGDLKTRGLNALFGFTENEYKFYIGEMAKVVPLRTPKCYYADMNSYVGNCCLIMEFVDAEFQDVLEAKVSLEDVKLVMTNLAKLHAVYHGFEKIKQKSVDFVAPIDEGPQGSIGGAEFLKSYNKVFEKKLKCPSDQEWKYDMPQSFLELSKDFGKCFLLYAKHIRLWEHTHAVIHGDARLDNWFFFTNSDGVRECGLLDWQMMSKGDILSDIAWFFGALDADFVAEHEEALFDLYFEEFGKAGGLKVEPGSEDRKMWMECYDLSTIFVGIKNTIGIANIDTVSNPRVVEQMNMQLTSNWAIYSRRKCNLTWDKFRNGTMIVQQRDPTLSSTLFAEAKINLNETVFTEVNDKAE